MKSLGHPSRLLLSSALIVLGYLFTSTADAQVYINEIYFDPPGSTGEKVFEYIELRGTPSESLAGQYLIFLENESSETANAGVIENIFDLTTRSLGTNGFLTLRQAASDNFYGGMEPAGTTVLVNTGSGLTFGSGPTSTIGHSDIEGTGVIENSGFTAMLIDIGTGTAPLLGQDLDVGDDGMSDDTFPAEWTTLDSIGINSEVSEIDGRLYAPINFSHGVPEEGGNVEPGAVFIDTDYEIEYIGRWGNSTGSTAADWHATNLTADSNTGSAGSPDFRQSGTFHDPPLGVDNFVETTQGVPYGMQLANTLGAPNLFILDGDFEYDSASGTFDNDVDGGDFLAWQRGFGFELTSEDGEANDATRQHGDTPNAEGIFDRIVDTQDLAVWASHYGETYTPPSSAASSTSSLAAVPEPAALLLTLIGSAFVGMSRIRQTI
ncbi:hypothetical protein [Adhaeretor mobilis]|uniref:LTD domain-containing protein n=1 Tax=Adhaeretor mobilis TaxID=1930276 RepID=A0A517N211_9BACT|nr:hypothetical protein [Adhaeretor mobilis]QDT01163.1 hypothetical protein HG15A2_45050 [Adhaeretor mobilis]